MHLNRIFDILSAVIHLVQLLTLHIFETWLCIILQGLKNSTIRVNMFIQLFYSVYFLIKINVVDNSIPALNLFLFNTTMKKNTL
jgi:hypothetical protein